MGVLRELAQCWIPADIMNVMAGHRPVCGVKICGRLQPQVRRLLDSHAAFLPRIFMFQEILAVQHRVQPGMAHSS